MTYLNRVYKINPYHGEHGKFTSKDKAKDPHAEENAERANAEVMYPEHGQRYLTIQEFEALDKKLSSIKEVPNPDFKPSEKGGEEGYQQDKKAAAELVGKSLGREHKNFETISEEEGMKVMEDLTKNGFWWKEREATLAFTHRASDIIVGVLKVRKGGWKVEVT